MDIYARIAKKQGTGNREQGMGNKDSNYISKAVLLEPDKNCCNKPQSISIEILRGDFARKSLAIFCAYDKRLPSHHQQRLNGPAMKGNYDEAFGNFVWHSGFGGSPGAGANLRLVHRSGPQHSRFQQ
jgi:hypothetical protein